MGEKERLDSVLEIRKRERLAIVKGCLSSVMNTNPAMVVAGVPYL